MGKQKCVLGGRGGSPERSGLRLEHEIVRREARLGSPRENTKPTVSISSWSLHGVDWSFTRPWRLQDTVMWSVFLLHLGVQKNVV